jgi:hypothetical protein
MLVETRSEEKTSSSIIVWKMNMMLADDEKKGGGTEFLKKEVVYCTTCSWKRDTGPGSMPWVANTVPLVTSTAPK